MEKYISLEIKDDKLLVKLKGELDEYVCSFIKAQIDYEYKSNFLKDIIFDFEKVTFIDSSALGMIICRYKIVNSVGGKVYIIGAKNQVKKIFDISNIDSIIPIFNDIDEIVKCS